MSKIPTKKRTTKQEEKTANDSKSQIEITSPNDQFLDAIIEGNRDAVFFIDLSGRILRVNNSATNLLGYSKEEFLTKNAMDLIAKEEIDDSKRRKTMVAEGKEVAIYERTFVRKSGEKITVEINLSLIRDSKNRPLFYQSILHDITHQKKISEQLAKERKILQVIAHKSATSKSHYDFSEAILEVLIKTFNFDFGTINIHLGENRFHLSARGGDRKKLHQLDKVRPSIETAAYKKVMGKKECIYAENIATEAVFEEVKQKLLSEGIRALIVCPILNATREIIGIIQLVGYKSIEITAEDKTLFETVKDLIASSLERILYKSDLEKSEEKFRTFVAQELVGVCLFRYDYSFEFYNRKLLSVLGISELPKDNRISTEHLRFVHKNDEIMLTKYFEKMQTKKELSTFTKVIPFIIQNEKRWLSVFLTPVNITDELLIGALVLDVTEENLSTLALERERKSYRVIAEAAIDEISLKALGSRILEGLIETLGFETGSIRVLDESRQLLIPIASYGLDSKSEKALQHTRLDDPELHISKILGKRIFAPDVTKHPITKKNDMFQRYGFRSYISWPIFHTKEKILGSIQLGSKQEIAVPTSFKLLLDTLARMLAAAIERMYAIEDLRNSQMQFKRTVENMLDGVLIFENEVLLYANDRAFEIFGFPKTELHSITQIDAILNVLDQKIDKNTEKGFVVDSGLEAKFWYTLSDNTRKYLTLRSTVDEITPSLKRVYVVITDFTEQMVIQKKLEVFNEELEQRVANRTVELQAVIKELESFTYSISHDLRSPLRGINGLSKILLEDYNEVLDEEGINYLKRIRYASLRMGELIDNLLDLSNLTRVKINIKTVNIAEYVRIIFQDQLQKVGQGRKIKLVVPKHIDTEADPQLLRIILENLISNAIKFSVKEKKPKVEFGTKVINEKKVFYIKDNGIGFSMEYKNKLFKPFTKLHTGESFKGSGIGLTITKRLIERHKGEIWVESESGKGTTFYFTLNISKED